MEATLITATGEVKGNVELPSLFAKTGSRRVLQEVLVALDANQRRGTSDTKTRTEVSGGGHKPWRQKGTGNARAGSIRSPLWRKGGIIFGPRPRSYRVDISEAKRRLALAAALIEKARDQGVAVLDALPATEGKTGAAAKFLKMTAPAGRVLLVLDKKDEKFSRAVRNLSRLTVVDVRELNAKALMSAQRILITQPAMQALESRLPEG